MMKNREIRAAAREELKGNWTNPVLITLVYIGFGVVVSAVSNLLSKGGARASVEFLISLLVLLPMGFGFLLYFLRFIRNDRDENLTKYLFYGFEDYGKTLSVVLLAFVYQFLWFLLFIIPGIIKTYAYAMTYYISYDNPELSAEECINRSMKMMYGHKLDLFLLDLSFIGWILLSILTLGIGMLWVTPYMYTSRAKFYEELKMQEQVGGEEGETVRAEIE